MRPDGDAEELEWSQSPESRIPMASEPWVLVYRCRRCGRRVVADNQTPTMAAERMSWASLAARRVYGRHDCADGGLGLADLIGAERERDG